MSVASAAQLRISDDEFGWQWANLEFEVSGTTVRCPVELASTFHKTTIIKTVGRLLGNIVYGALGTCTGGTATLLARSLPWHVQYQYFVGRLPAIEGIGLSLTGFSVQFDPTGGIPACLLRTTAVEPALLIAELERGGIVGWLRIDEVPAIALTGAAGCNLLRGRIRGTGNMDGGDIADIIGSDLSDRGELADSDVAKPTSDILVKLI